MMEIMVLGNPNKGFYGKGNKVIRLTFFLSYILYELKFSHSVDCL